MLSFLSKTKQDVVHGPTLPTDNRVSFELRDEDVDSLKHKYNSRKSCNYANDVVPTIPETDQLYTSWREEHPCILQNIDAFYYHVKDKRLAIFLDYDGTLTPIVSNPDEAIMSEEMRETVRQLAQLFPTGIISGRGREKVENFVKLRELYYAGSHGMDIAGPQSSSGEPDAVRFEPAASFAPLMDEVYNKLVDKLKDVAGASVEHNKFCISAHFRNTTGEDWRLVEAAVEAVVDAHGELRVTKGRKVLEVRPQVDWDKGKALDHLLQVLGLKEHPDVVAIYIGDDTTDEDAFRVLRSTDFGFGILVSSKVKDTAAAYTLQAPAEVQRFLQRVVEWGRGKGNAWLRGDASCLGWKPTFQPTPPAAAAAAAAAATPAAAAAAAAPAAAAAAPAKQP